MWAFGTTAAPIACCVLYFLARRHGKTKRSALTPALVHGALALLLSTYGQGAYAVTGLLLAPAFLLVQLWINMQTTVAKAEPLWPRIVILSLGLPLVGGTLVLNDFPELAINLSSRLARGELVRIGSTDLVLKTPSSAWRRVKAGTRGDEDSTLELVGPGYKSWLVAYVSEDANPRLDNIMHGRRLAIEGATTIVGLDQRRFFIDGPNLFAAAHASFKVQNGPFGVSQYEVLAVALQNEHVEIVSYAEGGATYVDQLVAWVESAKVAKAGEVQ